MDYLQLINDASKVGNWDEVVNLALLAKDKLSATTFLGLRKGFINVISGNTFLKEHLEKIGINCFDFYYQNDFTKAIYQKTITKEFVASEFVVIFYDKDTIINKMMEFGYSLNLYTCSEKSIYYPDSVTYRPDIAGSYEGKDYYIKYTVKNKKTKEKYKFTSLDVYFKGINRSLKLKTLLS